MAEDHKEGVVGRQLEAEQLGPLQVVAIGAATAEVAAVGTERTGTDTVGAHVEIPVVIGELVERHVVHAGQQGGFDGLALVVLDVDGPGLFAAGVEFVAHGGKADIEVEVLVGHADIVFVGPVAVLLDESGL